MLPTQLIWAFLTPVSAITMYPSNTTTILEAMNTVIHGTLAYCPWYHNESGATPGVFQAPYYWWEAGVFWGAMIDWSSYTGNHTMDQWIKDAIQFQSGKNWDFMTQNQTSVEGNDDQGFWGVTAMNAAEKNFSVPDEGYPPWLYFAQGTFNTMAHRWSNLNCQGGLRWQIYTWNAGYDYKNMVSNGCLFHLASRLAKFTNNDTYVEWADRVWDWATNIKFLSPHNPGASDPLDVHMSVYDGAHTTTNCTDISTAEWTYDQGLMISGTAYLYNFTGDVKWLNRTKMLWSRATALFGSDGSPWFPNNSIVYEPSCMNANETIVRCTNDQRVFKGILLSMLGLTMQVAPEMKQYFWTNIQASAQAAAWSCSGGYDGVTCGLSWLHRGWDNYTGVGEEINALQAFNTLLAPNFTGPYTAAELPTIYRPANTSGGANDTSSNQTGTVYGWGNEAGLNTSDVEAYRLSIDSGDKAGAGVLTAIVVIFIVSGSVWIIL